MDYEEYAGFEEPFDPNEAYDAFKAGLTIQQLRATKIKEARKNPLFDMAADGLLSTGAFLKNQAE